MRTILYHCIALGALGVGGAACGVGAAPEDVTEASAQLLNGDPTQFMFNAGTPSECVATCPLTHANITYPFNPPLTCTYGQVDDATLMANNVVKCLYPRTGGTSPCPSPGDARVNCVHVATCSDGIQNQGEAGIDCGGPCPSCSQDTFSWEVSTDSGSTWNPVTLPNTNWGCSFCSRFYRTHFTGVPTDVSFRYASDNEARMFVNGQVAFDDYYITGVDWCTTAPCCSMCCDTPANCMNGLSSTFSLSSTPLALFGSGVNEIVWQVNQEGGGSGFYNETTISY